MDDFWTGPPRYSELRESVANELHEDHVGLWSVIWEAGQVFPELSAEDLRAVVIRLLGDLLESGAAIAGVPTEDGSGFNALQFTPGEVVSRVDLQWRSLGRDPRLGEVVWLTAPENVIRVDNSGTTQFSG